MAKPKSVVLEIPSFLGVNTAESFSELDIKQSRKMLNMIPKTIGSLGKRPGTIPLTDTALSTPIETLMHLRKKQELVADDPFNVTFIPDSTSNLPAGTYQFVYTYENDIGESLPSIANSVEVPARIPNPTVAPTLEAITLTESLSNDTYTVAYSWNNSHGETLLSPSSTIVVDADGKAFKVHLPFLPDGASYARIYVKKGADPFYPQATTGLTFHDIISYTTGGTVPTENKTTGRIKTEVTDTHFRSTGVNIYGKVNADPFKLQGSQTVMEFTSSLIDGVAPPTTNSATFENDILVVSNNKLYSFFNNQFIEISNSLQLTTSHPDYAQFKSEKGEEVIVIADGGKLKAFDGNTLYEIVPAPNEQNRPENVLATLNTNHKPVGCLVHNTRLVVWDGSDTIWHSKIGYLDYFEQTDYHRFVREKDYIQTCVTYGGALVVFMRRHVGVLFGHDTEDWNQDFLDTKSGCLAPNSVQTVTFPDGRQEIFYLSDDGINAVHTIDTLALDNSARYSSRSVSVRKLDWKGIDVPKESLKQATGHFFDERYWLIYKVNGKYEGFVFDTRLEEWFPIDNVRANTFYQDENFLCFGGDNGHLMTFDNNLYSDWDNKEKTSGTPINTYWYSKLLNPELTGFDHFWDILLIEAGQFEDISTIDVEVNTYKNQYQMSNALKTSILIIGKTPIGSGQMANINFTDIINEAKRLRTFVKGQYAQIKISNNRDEPMEIYNIRYEIRVMTR